MVTTGCGPLTRGRGQQEGAPTVVAAAEEGTVDVGETTHPNNALALRKTSAVLIAPPFSMGTRKNERTRIRMRF